MHLWEQTSGESASHYTSSESRTGAQRRYDATRVDILRPNDEWINKCKKMTHHRNKKLHLFREGERWNQSMTGRGKLQTQPSTKTTVKIRSWDQITQKTESRSQSQDSREQCIRNRHQQWENGSVLPQQTSHSVRSLFMKACDKCQCDGGTVDKGGGQISMKNKTKMNGRLNFFASSVGSLGEKGFWIIPKVTMNLNLNLCFCKNKKQKKNHKWVHNKKKKLCYSLKKSTVMFSCRVRWGSKARILKEFCSAHLACNNSTEYFLSNLWHSLKALDKKIWQCVTLHTHAHPRAPLRARTHTHPQPQQCFPQGSTSELCHQSTKGSGGRNKTAVKEHDWHDRQASETSK